jgi:2,5-furandicarboxylate decarboxylase 1
VPVFRVKAITHRKNPIYQDLLPFSPEHHLLLAVPCEPVLFEALKKSVPEIKAVHLTPAGCGRFHAVIGIHKTHEGDGKDTILSAFSCMRDLKWVIVVDEDVNPYCPRDVEWAVATRFQADRDLVILSGVKGNEYDPSCFRQGLTAQMGMDATKPLGDDDRFERIGIPGLEDMKVEDYLNS